MSPRSREKKRSTQPLPEGAGGEGLDPDSSPAFSITGAKEKQRLPQRPGGATALQDSSPVSQNPDRKLRSESKKGSNKPPLEPEEIATLKAMVREYKAHGIDFSNLPRRPRFKRPRINSGITCNVEIWRRASDKAKTDPDGTGGSLSGLIELLLWKYLGCPSDVVDRPPKPSPDQ